MDNAKILEDLISSAIGAKVHFEVWWAQRSETKPKPLSAVYKHSEFFLISQDAHYIAFFVYLAHLFDGRKDSSSIPTYLANAKDKYEISHLHRLQLTYLALAQRAEPLILARHKAVAHVDASLSQDDIFGPMSMTWKDVRVIIYEATTLVSELAGARDPASIGIPHDRRLIEVTLKLINALENSEV